MSQNPSGSADHSDKKKSVIPLVADDHGHGKEKSSEANDRGKCFHPNSGNTDHDCPAVANASCWNLRPKKAMNWDQIISGAASLDALDSAPSADLLTTAQGSLPERRPDKEADNRSTKRGGRGFSISLSKEEIEADFLSMTGQSKLPKRPKKRPRSVQRELDHLFPGLSLTSMTPESCSARYATEKR